MVWLGDSLAASFAVLRHDGRVSVVSVRGVAGNEAGTSTPWNYGGVEGF